jgi:hypothetical protein
METGGIFDILINSIFDIRNLIYQDSNVDFKHL